VIWKTVKDYLLVIIVAASLALTTRFFLVEGFRIPTDYMAPGLKAGDHIFVNKLAYGFRYPTSGYAVTRLKMPQRGDVVVFSLNSDSNKEYIKRVIGLPGDRIKIKDNVIFLNDAKISVLKSQDGVNKVYEERLEGHSYQVLWNSAGTNADHETSDMFEVTVPSEHFFVLGDNRSEGLDSRKWGFLPVVSLKGKAWIVWLSLAGAEESSGVRWSRFFRRVE
jgi:signal peptidase I